MVPQSISHYRIIKKLGAGGMGEVWLAEDTRLERKVALKLLPAEFTQDAERVRRFMQEAKAASALNHPNIITVYDIGESEAGRFIVMELVAGRTLRSVIAEGNSLDTLLALGSQMAKALSAAHAAGITHRDIKPDNIMLREDGYVKVLDFGLARLLPTASGEDAATLALQTTPGMIMGTVAYMSPEQACGQSASPPSDIFALGIVLYELATRQHPFGAETLVGYLHAITLQTPPPPSKLRSGMSAGLDELILRMLKKDASQRPTASEVAQALQEIERRSDSANLRRIESETILLPTARSGATRADEGFWVAVLPFKWRGANAELEALAEGLTEDVVTGLSRFSYLRVIARSSTLRYASDSGDVRAIGKEVGARYVMEGNLRQAGSILRVAVQLVDAETGAHLWAETYDRPYSADQIFALQDDLVPQIVSTVADSYGILPHSMSQAVRRKPTDELTAYEALLRSFSYVERVTAEEHAEAKAALERAVQQTPGDSDCWAMLSILFTDEHIHGFSSRTGLLEHALQLARRAVDANPLNHRAYQALAWALCYRKEFDACRHAAERTVALNPMDASAMAYVGQTIAYGGGWERGCELLNRAMQLNPHHPGWYRYAPFLNAYRQADYRGALDIALKMNMPGVSLMYVALAAVYGQLGELEAAREAVSELLVLRPEFKVTARTELEKLWDSELVDRLIDGLRKAGLEIDDEGLAEPLPSRYASGESRADEGFWVAVLPFKSRGANANLEALAEDLFEDIVTGLSRFSYLRVIARGSTLRYTTESGDIRAIGKALGARYVMEGSLRQAGPELRIAVQLVDASTGAHLWAETYNRTFSPEAVFELQDELVPRIVSTVADWYGVLPHSMSEAVRLKPPDQLSPYEAVLRSFGYFERIAPEEHAAVRAGLERAVEQLPGNADGWAMLSMMYGEEHRFGFNVLPDPLGRSLQAARRAVDAAHANHFAWLALAQALFFCKEFDVFRDAAEHAIALNPMDGSTVEYMGHLIAFSGDWERGCELAERARQLNPNHPGWYWAVPFLDAYRKGDYRNARTFLLKGNQPGLFFMQALVAAVHGQLGEREAADKALRELLTLKPDFPLTGRDDFGKWYLPELVEQLLDGLRKAGLEIVDEESEAAPLPGTDLTDKRIIPDSGGRPAIAVLPFANMSADSDQEYFSDGLAEEIINLLAQVPGLKVIARTSAFAFRGKEQDIREIAGALGVTTVLQGSVRRDGSRLRVTAQLIDAAEGDHLWTERFDREMTEVFAVQDEIAAAIASALKVKLTAQPSPAREYEPKLAAYDAFLKGRHHYYKFSPEAFTCAEQEFTRAIALDPQWAEPHAALGDVYFAFGFYGWRPLDDVVQMARAEARKAVDILSSHPMGHAVLAAIAALRDYDWQEAEAQFAAATASGSLDPNGQMLCAMFYLLAAGRFEDAAREMSLAITQDPLNAFWRARQAWILLCGEKYDEAIAEARKALEFDHTNYQARMMIALSLTFQGELSEAREEVEEVFRLAPWDALGTGLLAGLLEKAGDKDHAAQLIPTITSSGAAPVGMMMYHLVCAEIDAALDWYQKDIELRRPNAPMIAYAGFLRPLRASPRWPQIARMMNLRDWNVAGQSTRAPQPTLNQAAGPEDRLKPELHAPSPSIAVLPFVNISNDPDNEYFCDGLAEELLNALSKIEALRVAARTSAFSFKGKETDIREIGRKLNVSTVLEGSVRKAGNRLRITTQLVNIADGYHLWSERYDREMKDIFDVQDEITLTVVAALKMKLLGEEKAAVLKHYTDNTEAYQLYLKGRYHANRFTREGFNRAIEYLNEAIEKDPHYALAYAGIADAYYHAATIHMPPVEAFLEVKAASAKALELDDALAEAHTQFAMFVAHYDRKPLEAESSFKRGLELAPNNVLTHQQYGLYLAMMGRFEEAIAELKRTQELDPLSLIISFLLGWTYYFARQPEKAKEEARKALEIDESFWMAHWTMALGYEQTGQYAEALEELERAKALDDSSWIPAVFARVCVRLGREDEAQEILDELAEKSKQQWVAPYLVATAYVSLDMPDQSFEWLQKALVDYDEWIDCINVDPALDPLRSDPRFQDLVRQVGLPQ